MLPVKDIHNLATLLAQPMITAEQAFRILGINRSTGYKMIRKGTFPLPVLKMGRIIRIPTTPLVKLLGREPESGVTQDTSTEPPVPDEPRVVFRG